MRSLRKRAIVLSAVIVIAAVMAAANLLAGGLPPLIDALLLVLLAGLAGLAAFLPRGEKPAETGDDRLDPVRKSGGIALLIDAEGRVEAASDAAADFFKTGTGEPDWVTVEPASAEAPGLTLPPSISALFGSDQDEALSLAFKGASFDARSVLLGDGDPSSRRTLIEFTRRADDVDSSEDKAVRQTVDRTQAMIEFALDGTIRKANANFLAAVGYTEDEIIGRHHAIFCEEGYAQSADYKAFWEKLGRGEFDAGKYKRIAKDGTEVWIQAAYNPVFDKDGKPTGVIKLATVITEAEDLAREALFKGAAFAEASRAITVAGENAEILFANKAAKDFFQGLEGLAEEWPSFDPAALVGQILPVGDRIAGSGEDTLHLDLAGRKIELTIRPCDHGSVNGKVIEWLDVTEEQTRRGLLDAFDRSQALIEFDLWGNIQSANENFLDVMGYARDEIVGKHHSMFAHEGVAQSRAYQEFWEALRRGEPQAGLFKRVAKSGSDVWLQAVYIPILDGDGKPFKIVKTATDVTQAELQAIDQRAILDAIDRTQGKIEFDLNGNILNVNDAFLGVIGYTRDEVIGRHHSMLCPADYAESEEYKSFWRKLGSGEFDAGKYRRMAKGGREIWIQAAYNPVLDDEGKPVRVIKFATDITEAERVDTDRKAILAAVDRSQASIEFDLKGNILTANENFLSAVGYSLDEIVGKHHAIFCEEEYAQSRAYADFWAKLGQGEYDTGLYRRFGKGGEEIWIQASYNPILDDKGRPVRVVKFATDVTEAQRVAKEAVYKSSAFEGSSSAMMLIDRDFVVQYVNDATIALFEKHETMFKEKWPSFEPHAMIGRCIDMFHAKPEHQRRMLSDPSVLPHQTDITIDEVKINLSISGVFDEDGTYAGNVLEWRDVTEERTQSGMLAAFDRAQALIEFTPDGHILKVNDNFVEAVGYSPDELIGKHHSMLVEPEHAASPEYREFWKRLAGGELIDGKHHRVGKGGRKIVLQAAYTPVADRNGEIFKVVKAADDITEAEAARLATEAEMQRAEEERQRNEAEQNDVVERVGEALQKLAKGDLTYELSSAFPAQYEKLRSDFNAAVVHLRSIMSEIRSTAGSVRGGARDISQAADDLSKRTENQAATLEETAAALDEITTTVRQTATGANEAHGVAGEMSREAEASSAVVQRATEAMGQIERSSAEIAQIVGVIDDIAFQTNLLALNAGVEAARAGDAGRGFAVVAQEVRGLAQRCSESAKEIRDLITSSEQLVGQGVELVGSTGTALSDIAGRIEKVNALIAEIAASAQEQSTSLDEVNQAMNRLDQVTQENAAMVEESTAASHSLTKSSNALLERLTQFELGQAAAEEKVRAPAQADDEDQGLGVKEQIGKAYRYVSDGNAALKPDDDQEEWTEF